jgi:hypothetical protein
MKTGQGLADFAFSLIGHPYMYGVNGQVITEALIQEKAEQYPDHYDANKIAKLRTEIGQVAYQCNSFASMYLNISRSADDWLDSAVETGELNYNPAVGMIKSIPEIIGLSVHYPGHMGIYYGNGNVVEARGTFYGVVETDVTTRGWLHWAKLPGIDYSNGGSGGGITMIICQKQTAFSENAKAMHIGLAKLGYDINLTYAGLYGAATSIQVAKFQTDNGLPVNGDIYDDKCNAIMLTKLATLQSADPAIKIELDAAKKKIAEQGQTIAKQTSEIQALNDKLNQANGINVTLQTSNTDKENELKALAEAWRVLQANSTKH